MDNINGKTIWWKRKRNGGPGKILWVFCRGGAYGGRGATQSPKIYNNFFFVT